MAMISYHRAWEGWLAHISQILCMLCVGHREAGEPSHHRRPVMDTVPAARRTQRGRRALPSQEPGDRYSTCCAYDTERPARPPVMVLRSSMANRDAKKTTNAPMELSENPSHLQHATRIVHWTNISAIPLPSTSYTD